MTDTTVTVDASRDLATIRLRTATGLYDIDVEWLNSRLVAAPPVSEATLKVRAVPTWEGVPIPDDLEDGRAVGHWKRGVTDAIAQIGTGS
jgi:hypothetical protein